METIAREFSPVIIVKITARKHFSTAKSSDNCCSRHLDFAKISHHESLENHPQILKSWMI